MVTSIGVLRPKPSLKALSRTHKTTFVFYLAYTASCVQWTRSNLTDLEMGTKLVNSRGKSLYEFWGSRIVEQLNDDLEGHPDPTVVNLASNEYFNAVDPAALGGNVINVKFSNVKDGEARSLMYYAKRARGSMARWIMENRVDRAAQLKEFNSENYSLDPLPRPTRTSRSNVNTPVEGLASGAFSLQKNKNWLFCIVSWT